MLFTLEALNAKEGDALLLHFGTLEKPRLILIDGGPRGVYRRTMKPRLEEVQELLELDGPVPVEIVMVSHIDADHIAGVIDLFSEVEDDQADDEEALIDTSVLWHNSFDDILGNNQLSSVNSLANLLQTQPSSVASFSQDPHSMAMIAGVGQGRRLRDLANRLSLAVNAPFSRYVQTRDTPVRRGDLRMTVIGPSRTQLDDLQDGWDKKVQQLNLASIAERRAGVAAFVDKSLANLSSIVVYAKQGQRSMLLTGDARGDFILDGLAQAGLAPNGVTKLDLLKVPHHGSEHNVSTKFFRKVKAKHYVFSADGKHDNPDEATLTMLTKARGSARYTMYFTNQLQAIEDFITRDQRDHSRNYDVVYRDDTDLSVWVDLGDGLEF